MLGWHQRSGLQLFPPWRVTCPTGQGRLGTIPATHPEFSEATLTQLLRALRARSSRHPDNPGLIASWPEVREDRMAVACAELLSRGHPVFRVSIPRANPARTRDGWAIRATAEELACQA
jgi:hypothetical protein